MVRHCTTEGVEFDRKVGEIVIPMIAFIEGGMTVPMGRITRDYLRAHKLCPHQCAPNFFRVLRSIDALDCITLQTSNGGTPIQRFRFYLQYLGGIASPSFFVSTIKDSRRYSFHFSSEFAISERSYLHIHHTFTKETSKILQRQEDQFASYPT